MDKLSHNVDGVAVDPPTPLVPDSDKPIPHSETNIPDKIVTSVPEETVPDSNLCQCDLSGYVPPEGEIEATMAEIWQQIFQVERIGRHDNFFKLGGNSIVSMKLVATVATRFAVRLRLLMVFEYPSVQEMAQVVEKELHIKKLVQERSQLSMPDMTDFEEGVL